MKTPTINETEQFKEAFNDACYELTETKRQRDELLSVVKQWTAIKFTANPDAYATGVKTVSMSKEDFEAMDSAVGAALKSRR